MDFDACYRAASSRDSRFDGVFFTAVLTTGIYCRPSCPAVSPKRCNVGYYRTAAAAQEAGFRACKRCRPDAAPGSPEWNLRADLVGRAMRLIADGVVDREGVGGLASRLGYSSRQLHRQLLKEVGAGPLALARSQRTRTARMLLEGTSLPMTEVAFAAGFSSIRQFNATIHEVFDSTPTEVRLRGASRHARDGQPGPDTIRLRLPYRPPLDLQGLFAFLGTHVVPGVEELREGVYRRVLSLANGTAIVSLSSPDGAGKESDASHVICDLQLTDLHDLASAVQRCRRLLDLDADPAAVANVLGEDPLLADIIACHPGRRIAGHVDGDELAVRAVLGQHGSAQGKRIVASRLVARYGKRLAQPMGSLTHAFPTAAALAEADPRDLPVPESRRRVLISLAKALFSGDVRLDPGVDRDAAERALLSVEGIGLWTSSYIRMRALGDPDAFLPTDLGMRHALLQLGVAADPRSAMRLAERWRPYRAYAVQHLWASLDNSSARLTAEGRI